MQHPSPTHIHTILALQKALPCAVRLRNSAAMEGKTGMLIGEKGVKYGLQKPGPKKSVGLAQGAAAAKPKPTNVFGADSDSDEDVGAQIARQAEKKRAAAKVRPGSNAAPRHCSAAA